MDWAYFSHLVGGFNPFEKYESQLGWWHSQYKHKIHVANHQPVIPFITGVITCYNLLTYWDEPPSPGVPDFTKSISITKTAAAPAATATKGFQDMPGMDGMTCK